VRSVLLVSGQIKNGGQREPCNVANSFAERGWKVHIAVLLSSEAGYTLDDKVTVHDLSRSGSYIKNTVWWIGGLRRLMRDIKPDVVLSFAGRVNVLSVLASAGLGVPVMVREINDPAHDARNRIELFICKIAYHRAHRVIFQTEYQKEYYGKWCGHNGVVVGNPVSAPVYRGSHTCQDILAVGRLVPQKNYPLLIRAFAEIASDYPEKHVYIYGIGSEEASLRSLAASLGLEGRVHLCGSDSRIFEKMQTFRYFVMTSNYEGLSNALLEALASGMICVTTDWNGAGEVIQDGINGFMTPLNDPNALACRLREIFSGKYDLEGIRASAVETGSQYSRDVMIGRWFQAIDQAVMSGKK